jgi:hypothetical protein
VLTTSDIRAVSHYTSDVATVSNLFTQFVRCLTLCGGNTFLFLIGCGLFNDVWR